MRLTRRLSEIIVGVTCGTAHGLVLCTLQAYGVFLKWAKLWEWRRFDENGWTFELPAYDDSEETWRGSSAETAETGHVR